MKDTHSQSKEKEKKGDFLKLDIYASAFFLIIIIVLYVLFKLEKIPFYTFTGMSVGFFYYWLSLALFTQEAYEQNLKIGTKKYVLHLFIYPILITLVVFHVVIFIYKFGSQDYSSRIDDWGDYATCIATLISFIAMYWIYKTYNSQIRLSSRMSFDQLFTQLLTNHHVIYQKVVEKVEIIEEQENVKIYGSAFEKMKVGILRLFSDFHHLSDVGEENIKNEYESILDQMSHLSSVNMRNYFKYVYYEISTVEKACIDDNVKYDCIKLIQSQMNHDELICYLINQIQHISNEKHDKHLNDLQKRNFFEDIIEYSNKSNTKEKQTIKALLEMFESLPSNRH